MSADGTITGPSASMTARLLRLLLGAVFVLAAASKVPQLHEFSHVIAYLIPGRSEPHWVVNAIAGGVLAWEMFLGVALLGGVYPRAMIAAAMGTLIVFTLALARLAVDPAAPSCGCLGLVRAAERYAAESHLGLVRNAALIWVTAWLLARSGGRTGRARGTADGAPGSAPAARAFTLVEVLVVIAVIGLLVALLAPTLSKTKLQARMVWSLSLQRQAAAAVQGYASTYRDTFPYFQTPGDPHGPIRLPGFELNNDEGYFHAGGTYWPNLLRGSFIEHAAARALNLPGAEEANLSDGYPSDTIRSRLRLAHVTFAIREYWTTELAPEDPALLNATHEAEVQFPAEKGLFVDMQAGLFDPLYRGPLHNGLPASVGWMDGSARVLDWYPADWTRAVERPYGASWMQVMSTWEGVSGRDF